MLVVGRTPFTHVGVHLQTSKAELVTVIGSRLPLLTSGSGMPVSEEYLAVRQIDNGADPLNRHCWAYSINRVLELLAVTSQMKKLGRHGARGKKQSVVETKPPLERTTGRLASLEAKKHRIGSDTNANQFTLVRKSARQPLHQVSNQGSRSHWSLNPPKGLIFRKSAPFLLKCINRAGQRGVWYLCLIFVLYYKRRHLPPSFSHHVYV